MARVYVRSITCSTSLVPSPRSTHHSWLLTLTYTTKIFLFLECVQLFLVCVWVGGGYSHVVLGQKNIDFLWVCAPDQVTIMIIGLLYAFLILKPALVFNPEKRERLPLRCPSLVPCLQFTFT